MPTHPFDDAANQPFITPARLGQLLGHDIQNQYQRILCHAGFAHEHTSGRPSVNLILAVELRLAIKDKNVDALLSLGADIENDFKQRFDDGDFDFDNVPATDPDPNNDLDSATSSVDSGIELK